MSENFFENKNVSPKSTLMRIGYNLKQTYQPYRRIHEKIAQFILPARGQFLPEDTNKGITINQQILDSTPTQAVRTAKAGMLSGITSPSRHWFALSTPYRDMNEKQSIKEWLDAVKRLMHDSLLKTSFYSHIQTFYGDLVAFGVGAIYIEEHFEKVATFMSLPIGSYYIGADSENKIDKFYREFCLTVIQVVERFGLDKSTGEIDWTNISDQVKKLYLTREFETLIYIGHLIRPNENWIPGSKNSMSKKYESVYFETGGVNAATNSTISSMSSAGDNKLLRKSGYDYFPVLAARWEIRGQDVYDISAPGFVALGDSMQLQRGESKSLLAIDKTIDPPMVGSSNLKAQKTSTLPGDITYIEDSSLSQYKPSYQINFNIRDMEEKQAQVRQRIKKAFYEDLFLMLQSSDRRQITAREVEERHEEKLLALGPVLENLNNVFDQLIDIYFEFMLNQEKLPPIPDELQGMDLKIEYVSIMAQAQKTIGIAQIERVTNYVMNAATAFPNILKKFNEMEAIDEYASTVGLSPQIIRSDEDVQDMIAAETQIAQKQQMQAEQMQQAQMAKTLAETPLDQEGSALNDILSNRNAI